MKETEINAAVVALMACALFMETLDVTIISTSIPKIAIDLGVHAVTLKFALTAYLLSLAVFIPASGWAAERFGGRRVFSSAVALFTLGSVCCAAAQGLVGLVLARLLQGLGGAMMLPVARLLLMRSVPKSAMVRATNYVTIPSLVGPALGPLVGGIITTYVSWRWVFWVNVPFGIAALWVTHRYVHDGPSPVRSLDMRGFILVGVALSALSFGFETLGEDLLSPSQIGVLFALSGLTLAAYAWHASRHPAPFVNTQLFRVPTFALTVVGSLVSRLGIGGVPFLLPLMLQLGLSYSPLRAGVLTMPVALGMILMKTLVKPILRTFGFRTTLVANTLALGATIALLGQAGPATPLWGVALMAFGYGMLASLQFSCMNVLTFVDVEPARMGDATSIASTVQQFSMSLGVGSSALCLTILGPVSQQGSPPRSGFALAFVVIGVITFISSAVFLRLRVDAGQEASGHTAAACRKERFSRAI